MSFDRRRLDELLDTVLERLPGDWLLIGGALVSLWLEPRRVTEDVDLIGLEGSQDERLRLMQFASDAGLPVEAVNTAADFFVRRFEDWRNEIEIFRENERTRIYRPSPTLFVLLKLHRLSEQDLEDCKLLLNAARAQGLHVDIERVKVGIEGLPECSDFELRRRREEFWKLLNHP